jgi:hypothetical protein
MVSTGVDSRDGNTVGDLRNKILNWASLSSRNNLNNEANLVNAKASTFKFMQVDVALNDEQFALAA